LWGFYVGFQQVNAQDFPKELATPICTDQIIPPNVPESTEYEIYPCGSFYFGGFGGLSPRPPLSPYIDFYYVVIESGGTFTFVITPDEEIDYDFGAFKNPNWEDLKLTSILRKRGSESSPFVTGEFSTGLALYAEGRCDVGAMARYFDVEPGDEILIAIDRMEPIESGYTIELGGDAVLECKIVGDDYFICIEDDEVSADFFSEEIMPDIIEDFPDANFSFYEVLDDAIYATGTPITFPYTVNYNEGEGTEIYGRVEDDVGNLIIVLRLNFYLSKKPKILSSETLNLDPICDDSNGKAIVYLNRYEEDFITDENDTIRARFYPNEEAYENGDFIESPDTYEAENNQVIIVEAVNTFSGCTSDEIGRIKVNLEESPNADLSDGYIICSDPKGVLDDSLTSVLIETGLSEEDYDFTWIYRDPPWAYVGDTLATAVPNLLIDTPGSYSVTITNKEGIFCEQNITFTIDEWDPPDFKIKSISQPFEKENGILVYDINAYGAFVFKVDDGDWQSPQADRQLIFENIEPGTHLVYGKSVAGCGELILPITILGYPDFFTPNADGINDTWNVTGLEDLSDAIISIFDRYGKLLTQIRPDREGWDGTFHGKNMPSNDYWFKIEFKETLIDQEGFKFKQPTVHTGHFTLKR